VKEEQLTPTCVGVSEWIRVGISSTRSLNGSSEGVPDPARTQQPAFGLSISRNHDASALRPSSR
jgi:hypothetical protein